MARQSSSTIAHASATLRFFRRMLYLWEHAVVLTCEYSCTPICEDGFRLSADATCSSLMISALCLFTSREMFDSFDEVTQPDVVCSAVPNMSFGVGGT